ncbi:hypothetical protein AM1341 [Anaplasma marginale str. St. Maries]|nr:hypothetical protein AM1341 [Anaplasma marginale str. St. Maries]
MYLQLYSLVLVRLLLMLLILARMVLAATLTVAACCRARRFWWRGCAVFGRAVSGLRQVCAKFLCIRRVLLYA